VKSSEKNNWKACHMAETTLEDCFYLFSASPLTTHKRKTIITPGCQEDKFINICREMEYYNESSMEKPMRK